MNLYLIFDFDCFSAAKVPPAGDREILKFAVLFFGVFVIPVDCGGGNNFGEIYKARKHIVQI